MTAKMSWFFHFGFISSKASFIQAFIHSFIHLFSIHTSEDILVQSGQDRKICKLYNFSFSIVHSKRERQSIRLSIILKERAQAIRSAQTGNWVRSNCASEGQSRVKSNSYYRCWIPQRGSVVTWNTMWIFS